MKNPYKGTNVTIYVNETTFVVLNVTKVANATNIYVGDKVEFTISVNNTGSSNATNVKVWDILPTGFDYVSGGHYNATTRNVTFDAVDIEVGKPVSFVVIARAIDAGELNNTAFAHADENETIFKGTSKNITVDPDVRLDVTKVVDGGVTSVYVGDSIVYVITVTNDGNSNATGVNVTEKLSDLVVVTGATGDGSWNNVTKVWNVGTLAGNGAKATLRLTVRVVGNGTVANAVVANSTENTTDVPANSTNVTAKPDVRLNISKKANVTEAVVGDLIKYTITVRNDGLSDAVGVSVWDVLPAGVKYVSGADRYVDASRNATWTISSVAAGKSVTVTLVVNVTAAGNLSNTVFANSKDNDTVVNKTSDNVTVVPNVVLNVTKKANVDRVVVGDIVEFTITVRNDGLSDATNVVVWDILDHAFVWKKGGSYDSNTHNVTWIINKIGAGESTQVTFNVTAMVAGNYSNVAFVKSNENNTITNGSSENITVDPGVGLKVIKTVDKHVVKVGEDVTFIITVNNGGESNATGVVIWDILNEAFEWKSGGNYSADSRNVTWFIPSIGSHKSVKVNVTVSAISVGNFTNVASVISNENKTPTNATSENVTINPDVRLNVTKVVEGDINSVYVGDSIVYVITVTNNGNSTATGVNVTEKLSGLVVVTGASDVGWNNVTKVWNVGSIESKGSKILRLTVRVVGNGTVANAVVANSTENVTDVPANGTNVTAKPDVRLNIFKKANVTEAVVGDLIKYTITVRNNGLSDASDVNLWDILPAGVKYVRGADKYVDASRNASWTISSIAAGKSETVTLVVNVTSAGNLSNTAFANSKDNDTVVNKTSDNVTVVPNVILNITKEANVTEAVVGDVVEFTITVKNNGLSDATNVVVWDILDHGFVWKHGGDYDANTHNVTWTIGKIAAGESMSVTVNVTAMFAGNCSNVAFTKSDENKTVTNGSSDNITVDPSVGFTVIKAVDKHIVYVGDNVTFIITVNNGGESNATNVVIWDILDEAFEWKSGGSYNRDTRNVTWTIPIIELHKFVKVNVTVTAISAGNFTNVASVISDENKTPTNASSENVTINPDVRLNITKTANVNAVKVGDNVTFTIVVTNSGLSDATNVEISDVLGDEFGYVSSTNDGDYDINTRIVSWTIDKLEAESSTEITLVVTALANGTFTNTVTVESDENKTPANATSENISVVPYVKLDIVKDSSFDQVKVGELINFTITVTNNGKSNATNVRISDDLVDAFEYVNASQNSGRDGNLVYWDIENIVPNESVKVYVIVNATKEGTYTNKAVVSSNENRTESNATKVIIVRNVVILNVTKTSNVSAVMVGDVIKFTITISNVGTEDATNVLVSDVLGEEFGYVSSSNDGGYDTGSRTVFWNISSIAARTSTEVTLVVKALTNGTFKNTAVAKAKENDTYFNASSDNITVEPDVRLEISKVADVTSAVVGDEIVFTITVTNNGLSRATGVAVSDVLNDAFGFVDATGEFTYDANTRLVSWTIDFIDSNSSATVSVVVRVLTNGTFANVVSVNARENNTDVGNSSDDIPVEPDVDLTIAKTANVTSAYVGDKIEFTITVTNNGLSNATNVVIEDVLPESVKFLSANGTYVNDGQNVKWTLDKLEGNFSLSVRVVVIAVSNGSAVNFANVTCSENSTSNTTADKIDVKPAVNLTVVKTANASDIFVGDRVSYNIVVTNNGPSDASNVVVVDELPNGLRFISSNVECVVVDNKLTWNVTSLAAGENITVEVICEAVGSGDLTNSVNVTCDENKTNATGGTPIHVSDLVDVAITLGVDNSTPYINGEITLILTVINYGPSAATEITGKLNRDFLTGLSIISIESDGIVFHSDLLGYALMNVLRVNEDGSFEIDSLGPGEQVSATIKARVIHDGNITVDGDVIAHENDSNLTNNHDELTLTVKPVTELDVEVTANETEPNVGDVIEYTITVTNNGPSNATGITANDKLPDGVTYIYDNSGGKYDPQTGVWSFDSLNVNETKTLTIKVRVNRDGEITNVVDVKSRENPEGTTGNATINAKNSKADLVIAKTVSTTKAYVGDTIVYTITIANRGTTDATGVLVYEDLLDGLKYLSDDGNGQYNFNTGIWNIGTLSAGETRVLNIVVQVTKAGNITNFVIVDCDQEIVDPDLSNDNVTVEVVEHEKPIENASDNEPAKQIKADSKTTGNPFVMLVMALLIAGVGLRRRKE